MSSLRARVRTRAARGGLVLSLWAAGIVSAGCKDRCVFNLIDRCDGDVWVHCAGGWMTFDWEPDRDDCRVQGKRCVVLPNNGWAGCIAPLGACGTASFVERCDPFEPGQSSGLLTRCIAGEELAAGNSCDVPNAPATSARTPAPSAGAPAPSGSSRR